MIKKFYITTPIYYVNDVPHIGHAYTTLAADILARYWRKNLGKENVFFLTGTDEHGQKIQEAAEEKKLDPKEFADSVVPRFKEAWKSLNISHDYFIRTTDPRHEKVVQKLLQKIYDAGQIYKGQYQGFYCVGCEKYLTETDLVGGKCPDHPNKKPVFQEEENYFLKLKDLSKKVLQKIEAGEYQILPKKRENEIVNRLKSGVEDISISRSGTSWGIPVPWDKTQTCYVWVDALINYYSATQFLEDKKKFWPADVHFLAKDILWFHAVVWQALLIAADIELPKTIFAHGFFTLDGQKISKTLGNVIDPQELVKKYGVDGTRYLLISAYKFGEDGDISLKRFSDKYHADLANGIGNTVARVAKLCQISKEKFESDPAGYETRYPVSEAIKQFEIDEALQAIVSRFSLIDKEINETEPWKKSGKELKTLLEKWVEEIRQAAFELESFLPETAKEIQKRFEKEEIKTGPVLFPRLK